MDSLEPFTETRIRHLLRRSFNALCAVDRITKWLVKDCQITNILFYRKGSCFPSKQIFNQ